MPGVAQGSSSVTGDGGQHAARSSTAGRSAFVGPPPAQRQRINHEGDAVPGSQADIPAAAHAIPQLSSDEAMPQATASVPAAASRWFCPVTGCPCADASQAPGWSSLTTMLPHLNAHLSGSLQGQVPREWLSTHGKSSCPVCSLCVAASRGTHPSCRPALRAASAAHGTRQPEAAIHAADPLPTVQVDVLPSIEEVLSAKTATLKRVPKAARALWSQALVRSLASAVAYNTVAAWTLLLMLPKATLCSPKRGGRKHEKAAAAFTVDRLSRWLAGEQAAL